MQDSSLTEYNGTIQFGEYTADRWFGVDDINSPIVQSVINKVKSKPELFEGFSLYIAGGILEGWLTWDIDWALVGPYKPSQIRRAMHWITAVGFEAGIYPDVTYAEELFDLHEWQRTRECDDRYLYRTSNLFIKNGEMPKDLSDYEAIDGMYRMWYNCPFEKNINKDAEGHKYKKPLKIF